jgi:hypothetical protein
MACKVCSFLLVFSFFYAASRFSDWREPCEVVFLLYHTLLYLIHPTR